MLPKNKGKEREQAQDVPQAEEGQRRPPRHGSQSSSFSPSELFPEGYDASPIAVDPYKRCFQNTEA